MPYTAQQLTGFIDLLVEAVLRDLDEESRRGNGAESGQEQRRRGDRPSEDRPSETVPESDIDAG